MSHGIASVFRQTYCICRRLGAWLLHSQSVPVFIKIMIPRQKSPYNLEQIACICETLYKARDVGGLIRFFNYLDAEEYCMSTDQSILRAQILVLFAQNAFTKVFSVLKSYQFDAKYHEELQDIWWKSHYAELEAHRGKPLGAVEKYRLRKKFPPPLTIWDGEEIIYSFKENSRKVTLICLYSLLLCITVYIQVFYFSAFKKLL